MRNKAGIRSQQVEVRRGLESPGGVVWSSVPELWVSVKKLRSHRLYRGGEAGFTLDLHWIAEPRGSERSTGSAVQVAVRRGGSCRVGTCS